jgi:hypothetical protein
VIDTVVRSGWDTLLLGVPFIAMLFCGFFRLDELIAGKKPAATAARQRHVFGGMDETGEPILCDPDGRPSAGSPAHR